MSTTTPIYLATDFYKLSHREQYPEGTTVVYSTLTPRSNKYAPWSNEIVVFGLQYFIKEYLIERFNKEFFQVPLEEVVTTYENFVKHTLGKEEVYTEHLVQLHNLGYLPIKIEALPEGTLAPMRCPIMTIQNTEPEFFWLTNFLETILSTTIWQPITSATLAYQYRKVLDEYALKTTGSTVGVEFQGHDFSLRGMSSEQSGMVSGMGHLTSFQGTDTIPAIFGDSITLERATEICKRLEEKGFASTNIVFGIGSFSYQYHTRDTFGFAVKATYAVVNGEERLLYKDPKTDDGTKRSQRGMVAVAHKKDVLAKSPDFDFSILTGNQSDNNLLWKDGLYEAEAYYSDWNALQTVFLNGQLLVDENLATIRERLTNNE